MPTYDYVCDACDHTFEVFQGIKDRKKRKCPECGRNKLAQADRTRRGDRLQRLGILQDGLSQRLVQESGRRGQAIVVEERFVQVEGWREILGEETGLERLTQPGPSRIVGSPKCPATRASQRTALPLAREIEHERHTLSRLRQTGRFGASDRAAVLQFALSPDRSWSLARREKQHYDRTERGARSGRSPGRPIVVAIRGRSFVHLAGARVAAIEGRHVTATLFGRWPECEHVPRSFRDSPGAFGRNQSCKAGAPSYNPGAHFSRETMAPEPPDAGAKPFSCRPRLALCTSVVVAGGACFAWHWDPRKMVLAAVAMLVTIGGWLAIDWVFSSSDEVKKRIAAESPAPWSDPFFRASADAGDPTFGDLAAPSVVPNRGWFVRSPVLDSWFWLSRPFRRLFDVELSLTGFVYWLVSGLWAALVWGFFGGMITRFAALELAREDRLGISAALRHSRTKLGAYFWCPVYPLIGIALFALPMILLGWMLRFDVGLLLGAIIWPMFLVCGFLMAIVVIVFLIGWPLMWATISTEGTDTFDALSRTLAYVIQRPLHYLFYVVVVTLLGSLGWIVVSVFAAAIVQLSFWGVSWTSGAPRAAELVNGLPADVPNVRLANVLATARFESIDPVNKRRIFRNGRHGQCRGERSRRVGRVRAGRRR